MQNFVFYNPTKIIFGRNTIPAIGPETAAWGTKALLVYGGGSIRKNGIYAQVTAALNEAGVEITEHGGVRSNPLLSHVNEGIAKVKKQQLDVIVAVGGGSVLDSAKAISAGAVVDHDVWKFFIGKKTIRRVLPLTTVLTLAASGSEMNSGMVITNDATRDKFGFGNRLLYPKTSILDPKATYSVPPDYTAYGAVDAISHVLEAYMTTQDPSTPVQDRFMEGLIRNAMDSCDRCLADPCDYQGRADLMWTATLALLGGGRPGPGRFPHAHDRALAERTLRRAARCRTLGGDSRLAPLAGRQRFKKNQAARRTAFRLQKKGGRVLGQCHDQNSRKLVRPDQQPDPAGGTGYPACGYSCHCRQRGPPGQDLAPERVRPRDHRRDPLPVPLKKWPVTAISSRTG